MTRVFYGRGAMTAPFRDGSRSLFDAEKLESAAGAVHVSHDVALTYKFSLLANPATPQIGRSTLPALRHGQDQLPLHLPALRRLPLGGRERRTGGEAVADAVAFGQFGTALRREVVDVV